MKKIYRTTSIVGLSLMSVPLFFVFQYSIYSQNILYFRFVIITFLLAITLLSFKIIDGIKLSMLKNSSQCFRLKIISLSPIKFLHVRGFYIFRIIAEYNDNDGVNHKINSALYSVLDFSTHSKLESFYFNKLNANIYVKNNIQGIEVIYK